MQFVFNTENTAREFANKNNDIFPSAPNRCPFTDCSMPVKLKKHGIIHGLLLAKNSLESYILDDIYALYAAEQSLCYQCSVYQDLSIQGLI